VLRVVLELSPFLCSEVFWCCRVGDLNFLMPCTTETRPVGNLVDVTSPEFFPPPPVWFSWAPAFLPQCPPLGPPSPSLFRFPWALEVMNRVRFLFRRVFNPFFLSFGVWIDAPFSSLSPFSPLFLVYETSCRSLINGQELIRFQENYNPPASLFGPGNSTLPPPWSSPPLVGKPPCAKAERAD